MRNSGQEYNFVAKMENELPKTKAETNFEKKKNQTKNFKYVKKKKSQDSYLRILHVLNAKDEI